MTTLTETINIAVSPALKDAIKAQAERESRKYTALARVTLERVFLANQVTLEQCAEEHMLESLPPRTRQTAEEFIRGKVLVDPPGPEYETD